MTEPAKRRPWFGITLLLVLVAALLYLVIQIALDNAEDPHAIGHGLLILVAVAAVASGIGWLISRVRR